MSRTERRKRSLALVVLALVASLVLAGCGGDDDEKPAKADPTSQATKGGTQLTSLDPLTGKPLTAAARKHPVVVVKIDNTSSSSPQIGLGRADIVVEEMVEGGITRLAVMFHSQIPPLVGPVRSLRATDIGIIKATHGIVFASGAAPPTHARLNGAKVRYVEGGTGYFRDGGGRYAPYNLMVRLPEALKAANPPATLPSSYLPFGTSAEFKATVAANEITARFSPNGRASHFKFDPASKRYLNTNSYAARDGQFKATNVLVLRTRQGDAGYLDPGGNPVPETLFTGDGNALLFHNGKVIAGRWFKPNHKSPIMLKTPDGKVLKVPAGETWIELLPNNPSGGSVSWK